jgi:O-antigen/teichoic acid export membrane protein
MSQKKVIANSIKYNSLGWVVAFVINFALLPFIVSHVGTEIYGAYILVMTFTGYLGTLDFGVATAVIKYVAEFIGKGDRDEVNRIISASFSFYLVVGIIVAAILFIFSFFFQYLFEVEAANSSTFQQLCWVAAGASLFIWPSRLFEGVLQGLQRYGWRAINEAGCAILTGISAYFIFAVFDGGIVHFLVASYVIIILRYLSAYIVGNLYLLKAKLVFPYFKREVLRRIFSFSVFVFLASLTNIIIFHLADFIIGAFVSVSAVAIYAVSYRIQDGFRAVNSIIGAPLVPAGAVMEGRNEYQTQRALLYKGTRYSSLVFVPAVIIVIVFAEPFIRYWMGSGFEESVLPAQVLLALWLFNGTSEVGSGMLTAKGYVKTKFKIAAFNAAVNLTLSLILVRYMGILGVALGLAIGAAFIEFPLIVHNILKVLDVGYREYFKKAIMRNLVVYLFTAALSFTTLYILQPDSLFFVLLEMGVIYCFSLLFGFALLLSSGERQEVLHMVRF